LLEARGKAFAVAHDVAQRDLLEAACAYMSDEDTALAFAYSGWRAFKILGCWRDTVRFKAHGKGGSGGDVGVAGDVGGGASAWRHDGD
jgi:hypothetical protein